MDGPVCAISLRASYPYFIRMGAVCSRGVAVADIGPPKVDLQKTCHLGEQTVQSEQTVQAEQAVQSEQAVQAEQTEQSEQAEQAVQSEQGIVVAIVVEKSEQTEQSEQREQRIVVEVMDPSEKREAEPVRIELTLQRVEEETTSETNKTNETNAIEQYKESIGQIERR